MQKISEAIVAGSLEAIKEMYADKPQPPLLDNSKDYKAYMNGGTGNRADRRRQEAIERRKRKVKSSFTEETP